MGIKLPNLKTDGYHAWTEAEIEQFQERHGSRTRARLALAVLLYTGQRRGDVVCLGRQHIRDGFLHVRQQKTGIELAIPIHPTLDAIIADTPADHLTLLTTQTGKPFTAAGFGNWFRDRCNEAGLAHCSAHGLRKAAARRLAEAGCTLHEIAAITGHASLSEVQRYTKAADQKRLALSAMEKAK
jgi:integrase